MQINQILKTWNEKKINKTKDENDSGTITVFVAMI
jgi:hypothetical protein